MMMWQKPWGYKEAFSIVAGFFLIGLLLQITIGKFHSWLFVYPYNIGALTGYLISMLVIRLFSRKIYLFRWMGSYPAAVSSLVGMVSITLIMGLTRQLRPEVEVTGMMKWLGFSQMLSAFPFVLLMGWFVIVLGVVTFNRLSRFRLKDIPFLLNHLGLLLALLGAVLGSGDMKRMEMTAVTGKPEWRAFTEDREMVELPLAVELQNFTIEEYPPKLMLINNDTGKALPEGKPENILVEEGVTSGKLLEWEITIEEDLPMAAGVVTEDTMKFVSFYSVGATTALYVKACHKETGTFKEGWVSCGSFMFPYRALRLTEDISLIMPEREPRKYTSEVKVYTESGKIEEAVIEVNKPLKIEGWKIYQVSYDETKGRWSDISIFELVKDPWLPVAYTGIWMMIAGAVCMFVLAQKRKEEEE